MNEQPPVKPPNPAAAKAVVTAMIRGLLVYALAAGVIGYFFWKGFVSYENEKILPEDTGYYYILGPVLVAAVVVSAMIFHAVQSNKLPTTPGSPNDINPSL